MIKAKNVSDPKQQNPFPFKTVRKGKINCKCKADSSTWVHKYSLDITHITQ